MNPTETNFEAKKEGDPNYSNKFKIQASSRRWSIHKNPRIVRVNRAFGGKDRHSKVCTVRGLRDRRIRLSVPTAIQLYDLQDRLGVNQPSKVVDWLLDATKHDINNLPPLPTLPIFTHLTHHQPSVPSPPWASNSLPYTKDPGISSAKDGIKMSGNVEGKDKWIPSHNQEGLGGFVAQLSAQNLFPLSNQSAAFPNMPYNPYFHLDHPNMSLSQFGGVYTNFPGHQTYDHHHQSHHNNLLSSILPSSNPQLYFCPSTPSIVPSFPSSTNNDLRQINHLQHVQQNPLPPTTLNLISPTTLRNDDGRSKKGSYKES